MHNRPHYLSARTLADLSKTSSLAQSEASTMRLGEAAGVCRAAVAAALAQDPTFGYGRVRRIVTALADHIVAGKAERWAVLRALMLECADETSARAIGPVEIPPALADAYTGSIKRIRALALTAPENYFDVGGDAFIKDLGVCLGQFYPGGARLIDLHAGLPRRLVAWQGWRAPGALTFLLAAGGFAPWFETHVDPRDLAEFSEAGLTRTYLRAAVLLDANPNVLGVFGASWFYDPCLATLSPHLAYLQQMPRAHGARLLRGETTPGTVAMALVKSRRRREAYERGLYRPQGYFLVWPRRAVLGWARKQGVRSQRISVQDAGDEPAHTVGKSDER